MGTLVDNRQHAAYWYATGRGDSHDDAWSFGLSHRAEAIAYAEEKVSFLSSVPDAYKAFRKAGRTSDDA